MRANERVPETIDEYIAGFSEEIQQRLQKIRATIRRAAPKAEERISYRMPAFFQGGVLVYFAAFKNHIGFFPTAAGVAAFRDELDGYTLSKGTIQFPHDQRLPLGLVSRIVKFRVGAARERPGRGRPDRKEGRRSRTARSSR